MITGTVSVSLLVIIQLVTDLLDPCLTVLVESCSIYQDLDFINLEDEVLEFDSALTSESNEEIDSEGSGYESSSSSGSNDSSSSKASDSSSATSGSDDEGDSESDSDDEGPSTITTTVTQTVETVDPDHKLGVSTHISGPSSKK